MRLKSPTAEPATPGQAEKPTSYRPLGAMVGGVLMAAFGAFGAVSFAIGSEKHALASAIAFAMVVGGVVGGLYPVTRSYADRLVVRNPFRTIVAPWPGVASVDAGLSLVLRTEPEGEGPGAVPARKFTIWSIPVSLHQRRKMDRVVAKQARGSRMDAMQAAKRSGNVDSMVHGGGFGGRGGSKYGGDPIDMMAFADQAVQEMTDRKRYCTTTVEDAPATSVRWNLVTIGASVLAAALVVLAAVGVFG